MMHALDGSAKAQAAMDFMVSYGIVLIALAVSVVLLYSFACGAFSINSLSGVLQIQLAQSSGGELAINGVACSAAINASGNQPEWGNIYVTSNSMYYPANGFSANELYSGYETTYKVYCYNNGAVATGILGSGFTGYVWMNYTVPGYGKQTQLVASINAKYT
jgi:hypothetical protein